MRTAGIPIATLPQLNLTSTQKTKISTIADKAQRDMQAKVQAANGDFQSLGPVIQQLRQKTHTDVMAILTTPQKGIVDKYEKDHPRGGRGGGGFGGPGGGGRGGGGRGGPGGPGAGGGRGVPHPRCSVTVYPGSAGVPPAMTRHVGPNAGGTPALPG